MNASANTPADRLDITRAMNAALQSVRTGETMSIPTTVAGYDALLRGNATVEGNGNEGPLTISGSWKSGPWTVIMA